MGKTDLMDDDFFDEDDEDTQSNRFLTFRVGKEDYGIEIKYVKEIVGIQKITEVPDMPEYVKGVVNLRGQVIPVMDVRLRFHMKPREYDERTCIIVVDINDVNIGMIVDIVKEVREILPDKISPAPKMGKTEKNLYVNGMGKIDDEVIIILDINRLLSDEEIATLNEDDS